jgi:hypothetical protein
MSKPMTMLDVEVYVGLCFYNGNYIHDLGELD